MYSIGAARFNLNLNFEKTPHMLIVGGTGSGKTYFSRLLLGKISKYNSDSKLFICDFKGDRDFSDISGAYRYENVQNGLDEFLGAFRQRQKNIDSNRNPLFLFFDEYGAFINWLDKKAADKRKKEIAEVLMLGRSFNVHVIIALQRADASYFTGGARDNFAIRLGLGSLSAESRRMMFPDLETKDYQRAGIGAGVLAIDGQNMVQVRVPKVNDQSLLSRSISKITEEKLKSQSV